MQTNGEINHSCNVCEDITKLFLRDTFSDVVFVVDGRQIAAHKAVLAARSPTFMDMFSNQTLAVTSKREIHIKDCSALSFKNFMKYIYTGKISLTGAHESDTQELLALALKYQMKALVENILEPKASRGQKIVAITGTAPNHLIASNDIVAKSDDKPIEKFKTCSEVNFEDIANVNNGAVVMEGLNPERLFADKKDLDEKTFTKHKIGDSRGIIIGLNIPMILNVIKFRLLDMDPKLYYHYYIQVSVNYSQWHTIVNYRQYSCRSWQTVVFSERLVKFIRIVGIHSSEKTFFSNTLYLTIVSFLCGFTPKPPKVLGDIWEPQSNIATIGNGAVVVINNGNDYCKSAKMINDCIEFEYKKYNHIYSEFPFNKDSELIIQLPQPIYTSSISFYIYGDQKFKYTVKTSGDSVGVSFKGWTLVADKRYQFNAPKWQRITFPKTKVLRISISNIRCLDESVTVLPVLAFTCP